MTLSPRSSSFPAICVLVSSALLAACGSSDNTPGPAPAPPPVAPSPEAPIVLLGESMVSNTFAPGGIAVDGAGAIYVGNYSWRQIPLPGRDKPTFEVMKVSPGGVVSVFVNKDSAYSGPPATGTIPERVVQMAYNPVSQTLYALNIVNENPRFEPGVIRPITSAGVIGVIGAPKVPTHADPKFLDASVDFSTVALAVGPDAALNVYGGTGSSTFGTPTSGSRRMDFSGWQVLNSDGSGRLIYSQESGERFPGTSGLPYSYTYPADFSATGGRLERNEAGMALDSAGNAYISDTVRHVVVKLTPAGSASILAGTATQSGSTDGTGAAARFNQPTQLVVDKASNVFVLDRGNATVRKITPAGVVSTVLGVAGQSQTKVGQLPGGLGMPAGLAMDTAGRLYVTVDKGVVRATLP